MKNSSFLVVGSITTFGESVRALLLAMDYKEDNIYFAANITQAMQILEDGAYDLVICDIDMGGIDLAENMKKHSDLKDIPVILAISDDEESKLEAATSSASSYETKPIKKDSLERTIKKILEKLKK